MYMAKEPLFISICNQKGGCGKSTYTVLLASIMHYRLGLRVTVIDADFPQWSIFRLRERELEVLSGSQEYKLRLTRQYNATGRKPWSVIPAKLSEIDLRPEQHADTDVVFIDLPGTIATEGVLTALASVEYMFVPIRADKMVVESSLSFARVVKEKFLASPDYAPKGIYLFWTMIDRRERTPLYSQYEKVCEKFGLPVLQAHIPARARFGREILGNSPVFRCTLFPPDKSEMRNSGLAELVQEICNLTILNNNEK